jgi:hypothetical protein
METQNNTKEGIKVFATTADLTGKEGSLIKLVNNSGSVAAALPAAVTDICPFILIRVNSATEVECAPFVAERNYRVRLEGAVVPGGTLILATGADAGKLVAGATGNVNAIAEEAGVDGQLVLVRPVFRVVA